MLGTSREKSKPSFGAREEYKLKGIMHISYVFFRTLLFPIFHKKIGKKLNSLLFKPSQYFLFLTADLNCHPMPLRYVLHEY